MSADKDSESPDSSVSSLSGRTDRQRAAFFIIWTEPGQLTEPRQTDTETDTKTDTGQKIRTADRHRTRFSEKSGQK